VVQPWEDWRGTRQDRPGVAGEGKGPRSGLAQPLPSRKPRATCDAPLLWPPICPQPFSVLTCCVDRPSLNETRPWRGKSFR